LLLFSAAMAEKKTFEAQSQARLWARAKVQLGAHLVVAHPEAGMELRLMNALEAGMKSRLLSPLEAEKNQRLLTLWDAAMKLRLMAWLVDGMRQRLLALFLAKAAAPTPRVLGQLVPQRLG